MTLMPRPERNPADETLLREYPKLSGFNVLHACLAFSEYPKKDITKEQKRQFREITGELRRYTEEMDDTMTYTFNSLNDRILRMYGVSMKDIRESSPRFSVNEYQTQIKLGIEMLCEEIELFIRNKRARTKRRQKFLTETIPKLVNY